MTVTDIFKIVVYFSAVAGLLLMTMSYVVIFGLNTIGPALANIPTYTPTSLITGGEAIALFLPTLGILMMVVLIVFCWLLSAFIKASPIGAVISVAFLIFYTIASIFVSHYLIQAMYAVPIFLSLGSAANIVFLWYANAPLILVFCSVVDIGIAFVSYNK